MQSDQNEKEEAGLVKAKLGEKAGGESGMNDGVIVAADHMPTNAGLFASALRMYGSDDVEVVTHDGREVLWYMREVGHTGLSLPCTFVHSLRGRGR
jgi:hypothetical protein